MAEFRRAGAGLDFRSGLCYTNLHYQVTPGADKGRD
jgi:hypothetical protein